MVRLACLDVPDLALQVLLNRHPEWAGLPAALLAVATPQSPLLAVNAPARRAGVLPGQRFASALTLARSLRADVIPDEHVDEARTRLTIALQRLTPQVEPCRDEPGCFWLGLHGLRLHDAARARRFASALRAAAQREGFSAACALGHTRFGVRVLARALGGEQHYERAESERRALRTLPLVRVFFDPRLRDALLELGLATLGDFLDLPAGGIEERFGREAAALHRLAAGDGLACVDAAAPAAPREESLRFDAPDGQATRLLFAVKQLLDPLLRELDAQALLLETLQVTLKSPDTAPREETLRAAAPTLDAAQWLELVRLRLESLALEAAVDELQLTAFACPAHAQQALLFLENPRRNAEAAARALARVTAELGGAAVARARLLDRHLPEARFLWEPWHAGPAGRVRETPPAVEPCAPEVPALVRRLAARAAPLPPGYPDTRDEEVRPVRMHGPHVLSGGWWARPVERAYHFAETRFGDILWIYHDRLRRRWFLAGRLE